MAKDNFNITYNWQDRKRHLGLPISFTKYTVSDDRLFLETGLLNVKFEEINLYRVRDLTLKISFWQRIFGVGSIIVHSADETNAHLELKNIKNPRQVKELIHATVEKARTENGVRIGEYFDGTNDICDKC
ncbi:MAG: PH domain-containing protein [Firmicutes bacterium]|nr:PH domain-containing protein [Bacillota bacterium]